MPMAGEKPTKPRTSASANRLRLLPSIISSLRRPMRKRLSSSVLVCILFPLIDFLLELPCLFLIREAQPEHTFLSLKAEKEYTVLIILEGVIDFLIPYHAAICWRQIHQFQPKGVAH
jgi:hypothetical protein